ncbi:hypothetical protein Dimus_009131 [Dionaea muscipula]
MDDYSVSGSLLGDARTLKEVVETAHALPEGGEVPTLLTSEEHEYSFANNVDELDQDTNKLSIPGLERCPPVTMLAECQQVVTFLRSYMMMRPALDPTLDGAVSRDLSRGDGWLNLQFNTECIAIELEDLIFDELLLDWRK